MYQHHAIQQGLESASKTGTLRRGNQQNARPCRNPKRQTEASTPVLSGNGFLNTQFPPLMGIIPELQAKTRIEQDFYSSAENLCKLYGIGFNGFASLEFPLNILRTFEYLQAEVNMIDTDTELRLVTDGGKGRAAFLASLQTYDTKHTLYYLPVEPLHNMIQSGRNKRTAKLLLSVLSYFYQVAEVPYFGRNDCYISYVYDMIFDWTLDSAYDEDEEYTEDITNEIYHIGGAGTCFLRQLADRQNLDLLLWRIAGFKPRNKEEKALLNLAKRVEVLMLNYPDRSIMDSIYGGMFTKSVEDLEDRRSISADQYISFIWSNNDSFFDQLMDSVNAELNEFGAIDEPVSLQFFDVSQSAVYHDLTFEAEFFDLLNELSDTLNDFNHEKYYRKNPTGLFAAQSTTIL